MLTILYLACVIGTDDCRYREVESGLMSTMGCVVRSVMVKPEWMEANPGLEVKKMICTAEPENYEQEDI